MDQSTVEIDQLKQRKEQPEYKDKKGTTKENWKVTYQKPKDKQKTEGKIE